MSGATGSGSVCACRCGALEEASGASGVGSSLTAVRPERATAAGGEVVVGSSEKARPWASELPRSVSSSGSRSRDTTGRGLG